MERAEERLVDVVEVEGHAVPAPDAGRAVPPKFSR
jgi:hypothetical protein